VVESKIKISGRSGCRLELINVYPAIIRKYSKSYEYNRRLKSQVIKQSQFFDSYFNVNTFFKVPSIIQFYEGIGKDELSFFDMEYVSASKFSDFFLDLTIDQIDTITDHLFNYLYQLKSKCVLRKIDRKIFLHKLSEVMTQLQHNGQNYNPQVYEILKGLMNEIPNKALPVGTCHGDFTFSNMLFKSDSIFIFDFLDSFVESYLIDIVKLRQDTLIQWSLFIDHEIHSYHKLKLKQILNYIDIKIEKKFLQDENYANWYTYLQKINLVRILQYLDDPIEINFIENQLFL
jgi:hypothetical protein